MEESSSKPPSMEADKLRSDVSHLLRQHNTHHNNQTNLNPIQCRAHIQLKQDSFRVVLTADKVMAIIIMDQQDYTNNAQDLVQDTNTYKIINTDPTNRLKNKLIQILKDNKQTGGLNNTNYKQLYRISAVPPQNSMASPKFTKLVPSSCL